MANSWKVKYFAFVYWSKNIISLRLLEIALLSNSFCKNFPRPRKTGKIMKPDTPIPLSHRFYPMWELFSVGRGTSDKCCGFLFHSLQKTMRKTKFIGTKKHQPQFCSDTVRFFIGKKKNSMCQSSGISAIWIMSGQLKLYCGQPAQNLNVEHYILSWPQSWMS